MESRGGGSRSARRWRCQIAIAGLFVPHAIAVVLTHGENTIDSIRPGPAQLRLTIWNCLIFYWREQMESKVSAMFLLLIWYRFYLLRCCNTTVRCLLCVSLFFFLFAAVLFILVSRGGGWWSKFANAFLIFSRQSSKGLLLISNFEPITELFIRPFQTDVSMSTTVYCLGHKSFCHKPTKTEELKRTDSLFIHAYKGTVHVLYNHSSSQQLKHLPYLALFCTWEWKKALRWNRERERNKPNPLTTWS